MIYVNADSGYETSYKPESGDYVAPASVINSTFIFEKDGDNLYLIFPPELMWGIFPTRKH
jgi:hypothetical protein